MLYLGIEIGGTKLQVVVGTAIPGSLVERQRFRVDASRGGEGIRAQLAATLPKLVAQHHVAAIGVGFGGPVDHQRGKICCSHQIEGWSEFPLGEWLHALAQVPVQVDNDANTAALAEARTGAGRGANPVFYVTLGSGVGGGCVRDGAIYHGALPGEAEIGHLRLDADGTILEQRCSGWAVDRRIRNAVTRGEVGLLTELARKDPGNEARHLAPALAAQDPVARSLLDAFARDLALGLSHVTHLFHPQTIVMGGGLALLGAPLVDAVTSHLPSLVMTAFQPGPRLVIAAHGEDAVPVGALLLAEAACAAKSR